MPETPRASGRPLHPTILAAVCDPPPWAEVLFDTFPVDQPGFALESADLVVVGSDRALDYIAEWLDLPVRPPLILTAGVTPERWDPKLQRGDVGVGVKAGSAAVMPTRPILEPLPPISTGAPWMDVAAEATLEELVNQAGRGVPLRMSDGQVVPAGAEDLVAAGDPAKQAVLGRVRSHQAYGLAAFAEELAARTGLALPDVNPTVAVVLVTNRPSRLAYALEGIARFRYPRLEVVVGAHGDGFDGANQELEVWSDRSGIPASLIRLPEEISLGECLNRAASTTGAAIVAKIDDDDIYGPLYLDEAVDVLAVSGADLVGKATFAMLLEGSDDLVLQRTGKENSEVAYVPGASFVMPRHTWEQVPFAHRRSRVDSTLIRGLGARGMSIWSSSRFEFVVRRAPEGHTWETSERLLLAQGEQIGAGSAWSDLMLES